MFSRGTSCAIQIAYPNKPLIIDLCAVLVFVFFFFVFVIIYLDLPSSSPTDPSALGFIISPWSLLLMPSGNISFTDENVTQQDLRAFTAPEVLAGLNLSSVSDIEKVQLCHPWVSHCCCCCCCCILQIWVPCATLSQHILHNDLLSDITQNHLRMRALAVVLSPGSACSAAVLLWFCSRGRVRLECSGP